MPGFVEPRPRSPWRDSRQLPHRNQPRWRRTLSTPSHLGHRAFSARDRERGTEARSGAPYESCRPACPRVSEQLPSAPRAATGRQGGKPIPFHGTRLPRALLGHATGVRRGTDAGQGPLRCTVAERQGPPAHPAGRSRCADRLKKVPTYGNLPKQSHEKGRPRVRVRRVRAADRSTMPGAGGRARCHDRPDPCGPRRPARREDR